MPFSRNKKSRTDSKLNWLQHPMLFKEMSKAIGGMLGCAERVFRRTPVEWQPRSFPFMSRCFISGNEPITAARAITVLRFRLQRARDRYLTAYRLPTFMTGFSSTR